MTFNPGMYILSGGGMKINGGNITGSNVTFYNASGNGYNYGTIDFSGNGTTILTAPTAGEYEGMLFFDARNAPASFTHRFNGPASSKLEGAFYFPNTTLDYRGNASAAYSILVARRLSSGGTGRVNSDYSSLSSRSPLGAVVLSE